MEQMKTKDAYMFPLIGSVVLFSLYLIYKFLPADWVKFAVKSYAPLRWCVECLVVEY